MGKYNKTDTCDECGKKLESGNSLREYNKKGEWTGRWLCRKCYNNSENSYSTIRKNLVKKSRKFIRYPNTKLGDLSEELTKRWRKIKNLNEEINYTVPIDHSQDSELGIIETKCARYNNYERNWHTMWKHNLKTKFDHIIFYCISKDGKKIDRIYIFPWEEVFERAGTTISSEFHKWTSWYEKYRIIDEDILKKVNDIWNIIINERGLI